MRVTNKPDTSRVLWMARKYFKMPAFIVFLILVVFIPSSLFMPKKIFR